MWIFFKKLKILKEPLNWSPLSLTVYTGHPTQRISYKPNYPFTSDMGSSAYGTVQQEGVKRAEKSEENKQ